MDHITFLVAVVIVTALAFDFTNGFHDTANAMATSISTGALAPRTAVLISGVLNVVGAFLATEVARTISDGIVDDTLVSPAMIFAGLVGAILWNLLTWLVGLPSSSSHALFGGLIGAVWVGAGSQGVNFDTVAEKVLVPAVASPIVAGVAALLATCLAYRLTDRAREDSVTKGFRIGQIASASLVSLAHGTNDAQKAMGVITLTLISAGALGRHAGPPLWVIASAGLAIGLGTYLGGWRIIRTMGKGLTEIQSPQGFAAETASTAVILTSAHLGFAPVHHPSGLGQHPRRGARPPARGGPLGCRGPDGGRLDGHPARRRAGRGSGRRGRAVRRGLRHGGRRAGRRGPRGGHRGRLAPQPGGRAQRHRRARGRHPHRAAGQGRQGCLNDGSTDDGDGASTRPAAVGHRVRGPRHRP